MQIQFTRWGRREGHRRTDGGAQSDLPGGLNQTGSGEQSSLRQTYARVTEQVGWPRLNCAGW